MGLDSGLGQSPDVDVGGGEGRRDLSREEVADSRAQLRSSQQPGICPDNCGASGGDFSQQSPWNLSWGETRSSEGCRRRGND